MCRNSGIRRREQSKHRKLIMSSAGPKTSLGMCIRCCNSHVRQTTEGKGLPSVPPPALPHRPVSWSLKWLCHCPVSCHQSLPLGTELFGGAYKESRKGQETEKGLLVGVQCHQFSVLGGFSQAFSGTFTLASCRQGTALSKNSKFQKGKADFTPEKQNTYS